MEEVAVGVAMRAKVRSLCSWAAYFPSASVSLTEKWDNHPHLQSNLETKSEQTPRCCNMTRLWIQLISSEHLCVQITRPPDETSTESIPILQPGQRCSEVM